MQYIQQNFIEQPKIATDYIWRMDSDYPPCNGLKVFSCFSCGGGSTMGYKLAGCDVIGNLEIDKKVNDIYVKNHKPKYNYCMDIRDFNNIPNNELPAELFELDILDGSPPCSSFTLAGNREKDWGKLKKFHEGQALQTLDDLPFIFIEIVAKLRPKFVIMENVKGLLMGNAWQYVQRIYREFHKIGYHLKHFLIRCDTMGIPQRRERVIFIATRLNIELSVIDMHFNYAPIPYYKFKSNKGDYLSPDTKAYKVLIKALPCDHSLGKVYIRHGEKERSFNTAIVWNNDVMPTITTKTITLRGDDKTRVPARDLITAQTFPQDYNFLNNNITNKLFILGMSVPPLMIKRIVTRLIEQNIIKVKN